MPSQRRSRADDPLPPKAAPVGQDQNPPLEREPYDPQRTRKTVEFWEKRVRNDPRGAVAFRTLAAAYLARQRETGDIEDAVRAEQAARKSLEVLPGNAGALSRLSRSLLTQHRFPEALEVADRAVKSDPQAHRLRADILLELGDYDAARRALKDIPHQEDDLHLMALRVRFLELDGKPDRALDLMREAQHLADQSYGLPHETIAWYHTMIGHALIDSGKLDEGERACRKALEIFPTDYRAMTGMAEAAAWRGDHEAAITRGREALAACPQNPEILRLLGDAYAELGKADEAERHYRLLKELAHSFPRIYDRHWALFCADTGRDLDEALALARKDLELRQDVHAYDTLAWASYKKGLLREAESAMQEALARGTQDASLFHHAGVIARAVGDLAEAESYDTRARALNPYLMKAEEVARPEADKD
jgi:tetratricopeptide (TPR) repeat protein